MVGADTNHCLTKQRMKVIIFSWILLVGFACSQPTTTDNTTTESETEIESTAQDDVSEDEAEEVERTSPVSSDGPIVYVTNDGDKYHTADCRYSKTAQPVKLSLAKADGKSACGICKPNSKTGEKQVRCSGVTAEGKQCQRLTAHTSGKCFQHQGAN